MIFKDSHPLVREKLEALRKRAEEMEDRELQLLRSTKFGEARRNWLRP